MRAGELLVVKGSLLGSPALHELRLSAEDGGGLHSLLDARVYVSVLGPGQQPPLFQRPRYAFQVREDAALHTVIGTVAAAAGQSSLGAALSEPGLIMLLCLCVQKKGAYCTVH